MQEAKEIQLIFDPGKGKVDLPSITALRGDRVGAMPKATRRGYTFTGWYTLPAEKASQQDGIRITSRTVVGEDQPEQMVLYAHWSKETARKKTSLANQRKAILAMVIAAAILVAGLVVTNIIIDIYHYEDVDGTVYTIKKKNGVYGLYHKGGALCDVNDDGYYLTTFGTQLSLDESTGEYEIYAVVDTEDTETLGYSQRVLMFKQLTYDMSSTTDYTRVIDRIEVHNAYGDMTFKRSSPSSNRFVIEGYEGTAFSDEMFAQLSSGCGYTISMQRLENPVRLEDGSIDYSEYGLVPEMRPQTGEDGNPVLDEEGNQVMSEYKPACYTVTTMLPDVYTGLSSYSVTLGDATVSGAGYYARYGDRDTVYILSSLNLDAAVLQPVEALVTPMIIYPMSLNSYFDVENFILRTDIDYDSLYLYMAADLAGMDPDKINADTVPSLSEEEVNRLTEAASQLADMEPETFVKLYDQAMKAHSRVVIGFSYIDMASRENTLFSSIPYKMSTSYMAGYLPNSDNISTVLQTLYSMTFNGVVVLGPDEDDLAAYGLEEPAFDLSFIYHEPQTEEDKSTSYVNRSNHVIISAKNGDGVYYAYSDSFDMIVAFDESAAPYLEWDEIDWYEREYYQYNIAYVTEVRLEGAAVLALGEKYLNRDGSIVFRLDNSETDQSNGTSSTDLKVFINGSSTPVDYSLTVTKPSGSQQVETAVYNFRRMMQSMLTASIEGVADLSEEDMAALRQTPDTECQLKLTVLLDDGKGNTQNLVYRFYRFTERRSYMTVEVLPTPNSPSSPANGQGKFYVLRSFCDKLVADSARFIDGVEINPDSKN